MLSGQGGGMQRVSSFIIPISIICLTILGFALNPQYTRAEIAAAMTLEALKANMRPYTPKLHETRGFPGAVRTAKALQRMIKGGWKDGSGTQEFSPHSPEVINVRETGVYEIDLEGLLEVLHARGIGPASFWHWPRRSRS